MRIGNKKVTKSFRSPFPEDFIEPKRVLVREVRFERTNSYETGL